MGASILMWPEGDSRLTCSLCVADPLVLLRAMFSKVHLVDIPCRRKGLLEQAGVLLQWYDIFASVASVTGKLIEVWVQFEKRTLELFPSGVGNVTSTLPCLSSTGNDFMVFFIGCVAIIQAWGAACTLGCSPMPYLLEQCTLLISIGSAIAHCAGCGLIHRLL